MSKEKKMYKLLKDLPECKAGEILTQHATEKDAYEFSSIKGFYIEKYIKAAPEWFAKYLFTTKDEVDIYEGEKTFVLNKKHPKIFTNDPLLYSGICEDHYYFSTVEAAQDFIKKKEVFKHGVLTKGSWDIKDNVSLEYIKSNKNEAWKYFDTLEERDEYRKMHKPEFSRTQVNAMISQLFKKEVDEALDNELRNYAKKLMYGQFNR